MVKKKQKIILIACSFLSLNVSAGEFFYEVQKGETISDILCSLNSKRIYGKRGDLKKALKLNPFVNKRRGKNVFPGEKINLSFAINNQFITLADLPTVKKHEACKATVATESLVIVEAPKPSRSIGQAAEVEEYVAPKEALKEDYEQYVFVRMATQVSWMKVLSSNKTSNQESSVSALSKASPGLLGNFGINVSDNFNVQAFSYLSQVKFYESENANLRLSKYSFFRQAYGIGGEYKMSPDTRLSLRAGFFDEFYLTMNNATTINVEIAQVPEVHWGIRHVLGRYKNVTLDSGVFGKFIVPYSSGSINGKFGYGVGGDFLLLLKNKGLRVFYNYSDANATNKSTRTFELGWNLVFEGRFYE